MGRVWYPVKLLHISYNLFAGTEMPSLSVYEPIAIHILHGGTVPQFGGEGVELGGRVWYPVKAHHNGHNLFIETDMLSLFVYEPYALQVLRLGDPTPLIGGKGVELGGQKWFHSNLYYWFPISSHSDQSVISNRFCSTPER